MTPAQTFFAVAIQCVSIIEPVTIPGINVTTAYRCPAPIVKTQDQIEPAPEITIKTKARHKASHHRRRHRR